MHRKLYRSRTNALLGGVCGGLGEFFGIDPNLVRLVYIVLLAVSFGFVGFLYVAIWLIVPQEGAEMNTATERLRLGLLLYLSKAEKIVLQRSNLPTGMIIGAVLILLGVILLLRTLGLWVAWIRFDTLWPILLIAVGAGLFLRRKGE